MESLTTCAFGRAARLTPKALRLYDELVLSPPTDNPHSGSRCYTPARLARRMSEMPGRTCCAGVSCLGWSPT